MVFSKSFPRKIQGQAYPQWEEVFLTEGEEVQAEKNARKENIKLMSECISDAEELFEEKDLKKYQTDIVNVSIALFEKRASHSVYWKERKAKDKFHKLFGTE